MNAQDLKKLLENTNNKFNIFTDRSVLVQYSLTVADLLQLLNEFLSDEEKGRLFELEHFKKLSPNLKSQILQDISDSKIKLTILKKPELIEGLDAYYITKIIFTLDENARFSIIEDLNFLKNYKIDNYDINKIIKSLGDKYKLQVLSNKSLVSELELRDYQISELIAEIQDEATKLKLMDAYKIKSHRTLEILQTFSDKSKSQIILNNEFGLARNHLIKLISSLNTESIAQFIIENREFMQKNNIAPYNITKMLTTEKQLEIIQNIENMGLSLAEKRQVFVTLDQEAKEKIDLENLPLEYRTAIEMKVGDDMGTLPKMGKIEVDFNKDLAIYQGLDELIYLNPMKIPSENRGKVLELCKMCPNIKLNDSMEFGYSTVQEFLEAENWIASVFQKIDANWSDIQKIAYIDNAIGKKISYSPDFDTEVFNIADSRALWKIIASGYGVCNGIAQVEKYMLGRIGVEAEEVAGMNHAFLKLKNVQLPNPDGTINVGDTILDPTWNLMMQRYGARPGNFCKSYAEIRKNDIDSQGRDTGCHRNDDELASATLNLDDACLRSIYTSIGLADENGKFPMQALLNKCKSIDDLRLPVAEELKRELNAIKEYCPDFAKCQNSTTGILQCAVLRQENLNFNKCVVSRVYAREDLEKKPVLYVYADLPEMGKQFYFADEQKGEFIQTTQQEFEAKFECYQTDLTKAKGHRPWESITEINKQENLAHSSGKIASQESEGR